MSAFDPKRTLAVQRGNRFGASFSPYQSIRLSRYNAFSRAWERARVCSASKCAREVALLVEEAIALILIHGDRSYAEIAAQAAKRLVQKS
jgi:hypothetical protein